MSLQRRMEKSLDEIERLELQPESLGLIWSMIVGMIGTIFLAISVFAITATNPLYVICILTGIIGIIGWILPFFVYKNIKTNKEQENISLIEEQYNNIYDNCEQARKLID